MQVLGLHFFLNFFMEFALRLNKFLKQSREFQSWFLVFGCFPRFLIILGLLLLFGVGLMILQFSWHGRDLMQLLCDVREKSAVRTGVCKTSIVEGCDSETVHCQSKPLNFWKNGCLFKRFKLVAKANWAVDPDSEEKDSGLEDVQNEEKECSPEDGEFDVVELRKLVKMERYYKHEALAELEKERMASATAAKEALAMIYRLQSEKSEVEIQANQFRRMAEQKQQYDEEVIEYLQSIVMEYESERNSSE